MATRWTLDQSAVSTIITGASRPEQVVENTSASELAPLPRELHAALADFYRRQVERSIQVDI